MTWIFGLDPPTAVAGTPYPADEFRRIAGTLNQSSDAPPAFVHADRQHFNPVVMHQRRRVGTRQNQRRGPIVRHYQHIAVRPSPDASRHALALARGRKTVGAFYGLTIAHHGRQAFNEGLALRVSVEA